MTSRMPSVYFVRRLDHEDFRPMPEAEFEIQVLNSSGETQYCAYLGDQPSGILAMEEFTPTGTVRLDVAKLVIPDAVIAAARCRTVGHGERVNEKGEILPPF